MNNIDVKIKRLSDTATMPTYGSPKAACMDLYADISTTFNEWDTHSMVKGVRIRPHETVKIGTGIAFQPDNGYMLEILQRSGLASKGIIPLGGIIDEDYRGEVIVILYNLTNETYIVKHGDKIAQMAMREYFQPNIIETNELDATIRGNNGFGSTGR